LDGIVDTTDSNFLVTIIIETYQHTNMYVLVTLPERVPEVLVLRTTEDGEEIEGSGKIIVFPEGPLRRLEMIR
jgi:hypothetical protein